MARKVDSGELTTEVWGLNFIVKGRKLAFVVSEPTGKRKKFWTTMGPKMAAAVGLEVKEYLDHKEEESKLTPEELRERYQEYGGS